MIEWDIKGCGYDYRREEDTACEDTRSNAGQNRRGMRKKTMRGEDERKGHDSVHWRAEHRIREENSTVHVL